MPISRTSSSNTSRIARAGGLALAAGLALTAPQAFAGDTPAGVTPTGVTGQAVPDSGASFQQLGGIHPLYRQSAVFPVHPFHIGSHRPGAVLPH